MPGGCPSSAWSPLSAVNDTSDMRAIALGRPNCRWPLEGFPSCSGKRTKTAASHKVNVLETSAEGSASISKQYTCSARGYKALMAMRVLEYKKSKVQLIIGSSLFRASATC